MRFFIFALLGLAVAPFGPGNGFINLYGQDKVPLRIESWTKSDTGMGLILATEPGERYRIESSTNLQSWRTALVSEAAWGPSLSVFLEESPAPARFYRVSRFEWEEMRADLESARQRWLEQGWVNYEFEFRWICFSCLPDYETWKQITVRDGSITRVVKRATGELMPEERWSDYRTLAELFDWIGEKLGMRPEYAEVQFDDDWGTPLWSFFDQTSLIADEESGFQVTAFPMIQLTNNLGGGLTAEDSQIIDGAGQTISWTGQRLGDVVTLTRQGLRADGGSFRHEVQLRRREGDAMPLFISAVESNTPCCEGDETPVTTERRFERGIVEIQAWDPEGVVSGRLSGDFDWIFHASVR